MKFFNKTAPTYDDIELSLMDRILRCQPKLSYIIAITDLMQSLFFTVEATLLVISSNNLYSDLALVGSIIWVLVDVLLLVGLWKCRPGLVKYWLAFTLIGLITDIVYLLWSIMITVMINWTRIMLFTILYAGIVFEFVCFYLVYRYYLVMDPCCFMIIEDGKKCPLDDEEPRKKEKEKKKEKKQKTENTGQD